MANSDPAAQLDLDAALIRETADEKLDRLARAVVLGDRGKAEWDFLELVYALLAEWTCRFLGRSVDRDDALQEAVLKIVAKLGTWNQTAHVRVWCYSVAMNEFRDMWRHAGTCLEHRESADDQADPIDHASTELTPLEAVERADEAARWERSIRTALKSVSPIHRDVIVLYHFGGWSCKEIASLLGRTEKAIKQLLPRARNALRHSLELNRSRSSNRLSA